MRNFYAFFVLAFFAFSAHAQIVNIPDPAFKNYLVNTNCTDVDGGNYTINGNVDTNGDGEVQVSEALATKVLEFDGMDNLDLTGLEAFANLEFIYFVNSNHMNIDLSVLPSLTTLEMHTGTFDSLNLSALNNLKTFMVAFCDLPATDFSSLAGLEHFSAWQCTIPSLDLSNLTNLKDILMEGPEGSTQTILTSIGLDGLVNLESLKAARLGLTSIDLSDLDNLTALSCYENLLNSIDLSNLSLLKSLECGSNQLTSIDLSNAPLLESIACENNQLTTLDLSPNPIMRYVFCFGNQLTSLDLSNGANILMLYCGDNQLTSLDTTNLLSLKWIGASDNLFTTLDFSYSQGNTWNNLNFSNNPNLTYLNLKNGANFWFHQGESFQADDCPNLQYVCANEPNFHYIQDDLPQATVSSYCSFTPGGVFNTISGTLTFDLDNDGCDAGDAVSLNSKMKISSNFSSGVTFANASGNYLFFTQTGGFNVMPEFENPYFTVSPASMNFNILNLDGTDYHQDFCITPNGVHNDVEITIVPTQGPRPGFDAHYRLVYKNKGNQTRSGAISLNFNDVLLDLVWAAPMLSSQTLGTLNWTYDNLLPFETRSIEVVLNVNSPQEIPAVNDGDLLNFTATINPISGDETINDNTFNLEQTVRNSYDPNDKTCLEGANVAPEKIGDYLHYVIRFQNSGTAPAQNVVVKDVIDTDKYDLSTLQLTSVSHRHVTRISGNKIEFFFENINLPAEQDDEPGSHGFVSFKIKTKNNLAVGSSVSNKADIYFDYNFPITTEPAVTQFSLLARDQFEDRSIEMYPNPVKDKLSVNAKSNIQSISVYDLQGRLIETHLPNATTSKIDFASYALGTYLVKITTYKGSRTQKVIRQ